MDWYVLYIQCQKMNSKKNVKRIRKTSNADPLLFPIFAASALSHLTIKPLVSLDNHSPVKPPPKPPSIDPESKEVNLMKTILITPSNLTTSNHDFIPDLSNPVFMEMDGTHNHDIKTPMTLPYGREPENTSDNNKYNDSKPSIKESLLNLFKSPLETCAMAGG